MTAHAKLHSPSGAYRWMKCPGQPLLCKDIPRKTNIYATTGTAAHTLAESCIRLGGGNCVEKFIGKTIKADGQDIVVTEEMADAVQVYVDEVMDIKRPHLKMKPGCNSYDLNQVIHPGVEFGLEERLDLEWITPGMFGTGDFTMRQFMGEGIILDYKNGVTVVEVEDNSQLLIYALGLIGKDNPHMLSEVSIGIVQPNAFHTDGSIRYETYSVEELNEWKNDVLIPAVKATLEPDAPLVTGSWCRWCPAAEARKCPLLIKDMFGNVPAKLDKDSIPVEVVPMPDPGDWTSEQLDRFLELSDAFKDLMESAENEAYNRIKIASADAPRKYKIVAGRGSRKWKDENEAATVLAQQLDDAYEHKLLSVAKAEKALKKTEKGVPDSFNDNVVKTPGQPKLAHITDKRKALTMSEEMFK